MLEVGSVWARAGLKVDDDGFSRFGRLLDSARRDARNGAEADLKADVDSTGFRKYDSALDKADRDTHRSTGRMGAAFGVMGRAAAAGAAAGGAALGYFGIKSLDTASDINESLTKNLKLFGDHAAEVDAWSKTTARALGISRAEALESAGSFGSLFKTIGESEQEGAKMSTRLVQLAADLASFNNASPEEALEALRSGLIGEAEPMRRFGVLLSEQRVAQEAYREGIAKSGAELTEQEKVQARYSLILKDSKQAHGDFADTSGGLANQVRILKAQFSDTAATVGQKLLPVAVKVVTWFNDLIAGGDGASGTMGKIAGAASSAASAVGDAIGGIVGFIKGFVEENRGTIESIGGTLGRIAGVVGDALSGIGRAIADVFGSGGFGDDVKKIGGFLLGFQDVVLKIYEAVVKRSLPGIVTAFKGLAQIIRGVVRVIAGILTLDFGKALDGLGDLFGGTFRLIFGLLRSATAPFRELASRVGSILSGLVRGPVDFLVDGIRSAVRLIGRLLGGFADAAGDVGRVAGRALEFVVGGAFNTLKDIARGAIHFIIGALDTFLGGISSVLRVAGKLPIVGDKFDRIADAVDGAREDLRGFDDSLDKIDGKEVRVKVTGVLGIEGIQGPQGGSGLRADAADLIQRAAQQKVNSGTISPSLLAGLLGSSVDSINPIAARYGLSITSGYRAGDDGWHGQNRARDYSNSTGPTPQMMAFARFMASAFGGKLLELIYTPLGFGIKNGTRVPNSFWGASVLADHYDHVHVAMRHGGAVGPSGRLEGGKVGPFSGGLAAWIRNGIARIAGEGSKDEWVISQEGDRRANIGWAREALETLTGKRAKLYAGGKGLDKMRGRATGLGETIALREGAIEQRERYYSRLERRYSNSQEEFLVEDADGNLIVDEDAIDKRAEELDDLWRVRKQIRGMVFRLRNALLSAQAVLNRLVPKLRGIVRRARKAVDRAKGKKAKQRAQERYENVRNRYGAQADEYADLSEDYKSRSLEAWNDWKDMRVDLDEIAGERAEVTGTTAPPVEAEAPDTFGPDYLSGKQDTKLGGLLLDQAKAGVTADTGDDEAARGALESFWRGVLKGDLTTAERIDALQQLSGFLPTPADTGAGGDGGSTPTGPTPEQIAAGVLEQLANFQSSRAALFGGFGANFMLGGALSPAMAAAGLRYFGGGGGGTTPGVLAGGGGITQNIALTLNDPGDVHTFTQAALWEAQAAAA